MQERNARRFFHSMGLLVPAAMLITACGGDDKNVSIPSSSSLAAACPGLTNIKIASKQIGLPSGDATIKEAKLVASDLEGTGLAEYCQVKGSIAALTNGADPIQFQINLPTTWNEKGLMYGGGGFNGSLVTGTTTLRDAEPGQKHPITKGYATFGTDSGHDASTYVTTDPAKFALNDEMFLNFAHQSYKKVKDVAHEVMSDFYKKRPDKQYYYGGSEGGREGLTMAQRYPKDFDGIVSTVPVINWTGLFNGFVSYTQPQFSGGALNSQKIKLVAQKVNDVCDAMDGLADGVVSDYLGCVGKMDLNVLRCGGGVDTGDTCLSDAQLTTLRSTYGETVSPYARANGITKYPGRLFGGEIQMGGEGIGRWITNGSVPSQPIAANDGRGVIYGSSYARYVIARDANYDIRKFDPANFEARIKEVSELMDSTNPDLSAFYANGGKLILKENAGDMAQSALAGARYFDSVVAKMGNSAVKDFVRFYVTPAASHSGGVASFTTGEEIANRIDLLTVLDNWSSEKKAPANTLELVQKNASAPFATTASRPLCSYPNYPHYIGGAVTSAKSFECRAGSN